MRSLELAGSPRVAGMDDADLLQAFDTQIRRRPRVAAGLPGRAARRPGAGAADDRRPAADAAWGGGVFWCDLDESTADAAIAAAVEWFRPRRPGVRVEALRVRPAGRPP